MAEIMGRRSGPYTTREIITKAVCGFGEKSFQYMKLLRLPENEVLTRVLGASITRVVLPEPKEMTLPTRGEMYVPVAGSFDINVWYAYNDHLDTAVLRDRVTVSEMLPTTITSTLAGDEVRARVALTRPPECTLAEAEDEGTIKVVVVFDVQAEIIAETKVAVQVITD
ncbi:MAG: outer spore coat protein CotE [Firmicutes bacterium]|nr:outer spore coat protein CotE [Bacillota bacterium]